MTTVVVFFNNGFPPKNPGVHVLLMCDSYFVLTTHYY